MKKIFATLVLICLPLLAGAQININTASLAELDDIPYVGEAIARNIVEYRNTNGPFKKIEDIINVSRIGDSTFLKMKDYITVGSDSPSSSSSDNSTDNQIVINDDDNTFDSDDNSSHTGETSLSDYSAESLKIGAGRERLATVRTPIVFTASSNKKGKESNLFVWSFGDGTSAYGAKVYHAYQFPGRYNVVLNGTIDQQEEAVARTTVLVAEAKVKITNLDSLAGFVEISNESDKEQNLNGWILQAEGKKYVFPMDTIISPKSAIKIPLGVVGFTNQEVRGITLAYPDGGVVSNLAQTEEINQQKIAELKKQLVRVRQQIAQNYPETTIAKNPIPKEETIKEKGDDVVVLEKKVGWLGKIKNAIFK
jgi:competence protein ComEA